MYRIGFGTDIHRLTEGRPLIVGGVNIEAPFGADGHSDADVLLHAITDALLGSLALGDLGSHFPDSNEKWRGSESVIFLQHAVQLLSERGFAVENIDCVIDLEKPKLRDHIEAMRQNIAACLSTTIQAISIKAKTGEKVDSVGESRAIRAQAVALVRRIS